MSKVYTNSTTSTLRTLINNPTSFVFNITSNIISNTLSLTPAIPRLLWVVLFQLLLGPYNFLCRHELWENLFSNIFEALEDYCYNSLSVRNFFSQKLIKLSPYIGFEIPKSFKLSPLISGNVILNFASMLNFRKKKEKIEFSPSQSSCKPVQVYFPKKIWST